MRKEEDYVGWPVLGKELDKAKEHSPRYCEKGDSSVGSILS